MESHLISKINHLHIICVPFFFIFFCKYVWNAKEEMLKHIYIYNIYKYIQIIGQAKRDDIYKRT